MDARAALAGPCKRGSAQVWGSASLRWYSDRWTTNSRKWSRVPEPAMNSESDGPSARAIASVTQSVTSVLPLLVNRDGIWARQRAFESLLEPAPEREHSAGPTRANRPPR